MDGLDWVLIMVMVFKSEPSSLTHSIMGAGLPDAVHERLKGSLSNMNMVVSLTGCVCISGGTVCVL